MPRDASALRSRPSRASGNGANCAGTAGSRRTCRDVQVRSVGPFGDLAGRQPLQRLVERAVTP